MLISKILRSKRPFITASGESIVDLISSTFSFLRTGERSDGLIRVQQEEAMRPDLISDRVYSSHEYYDLLLKYNGISNPFSIAPGEILIAPPFKEFNVMLTSPKTVFEKGEERKATTEDKLLNPKTVKDKKRLEALKDRVKEIVPPNVNTAGNRNVKVKDGKVIFGEDVTQVNKDNCPVPISRARLIQQLTKSSLF